MTIEEAIKWIQEEKASYERAPDLNGCPMTECWQKAIDVYDMAISALRKQDVTDKYVGKMTNAQKIRAMSDEELAELIDRETDSCAPTGDCEKMSRDCKACWLEWRQRPSGEEGKHETD